MIQKILLALAGSVALATGASAQQILTQFTFETTAPTTAGPFAAEMGSGVGSGFHAGASAYTSPSGNGSSHSYSSNTWAVGDYYQFTLGTAPTAGIYVTFGATGSNTGPANFSFVYSTDGGSTFTATTVNPYTLTNDSWTATGGVKSVSEKSFDLSSVTALIADPNDVFRLVCTSTTAISGTFGTSGTSRVDDFTVSTGGFVFPVPEPSTYAIALAGLALFAFGQVVRHRKA